MRLKANGHTPKEEAIAIAVGWLHNAYFNKTGDLDKLTGAERREVKKQIAKLHNSLAEKIGYKDSAMLFEEEM